MVENNFNLTNTTKAKLPSLAFVDMKDAILGKKYELSIIIVSKKEIQRLNNIYREINKPTDILSFPLSENFGEIYINIEMTKIEAKNKAESLGAIVASDVSKKTDYVARLYLGSIGKIDNGNVCS